MNVQSEKYKLIEWITSLEDSSILELLKSIRQKTSEVDQNFSNKERQYISEMLERSENEIREGKIHAHENVMAEIRERYGLGK